MAIRRNNFEGGTSGATITPANSGGASGDAFTGVEATLTYSPSAAWRGSMGAISTADSTTAGVRAAISSTIARGVLHFKVNALPTTGELHLLSVYLGTTRYASWHINIAGYLRLADAAANVYTCPNTLSPNTFYRLELLVNSGTTTSNGTAIAAYYLAGSTTALGSFSSSAVNTGAGAVYDRIYFGKRSAVPILVSFDEVAWDTEGSALIGPPPAIAPTIQHTETPGYCVIDMTGSTASDGSTLSYSITPNSGVVEFVEGRFMVPQLLVPTDYTVTTTQSGVDYTTVITVPALSTGYIDSLRERVWNGSTWQ